MMINKEIYEILDQADQLLEKIRVNRDDIDEKIKENVSNARIEILEVISSMRHRKLVENA